MNEIKVTVEYEVPKTNLFDELMRDYKEIEKKSRETINYYKPLADVAELTKLELILKQLETIKQYVLQLHNINGDFKEVECYISHKNHHSLRAFRVGLHGIVWDNMSFCETAYKNYPYYFNADRCDSLNILGNWDEWQVYKKLESKCLSRLKHEMEQRKKEAEHEKMRLKNITD